MKDIPLDPAMFGRLKTADDRRNALNLLGQFGARPNQRYEINPHKEWVSLHYYQGRPMVRITYGGNNDKEKV